MGIVTDVIQEWLPVNSSLTSAILTSIPFFVIAVFLIIYLAFSRPGERGRLDRRRARPRDPAAGRNGGRGAEIGARAPRWSPTRTGWSLYMLGPVVVIAHRGAAAGRC